MGKGGFMKKKNKKSGKRVGIALMAASAVLLSGCSIFGMDSEKEDTKETQTVTQAAVTASDGTMVFHELDTELSSEELFRIDGAVCTKKEYRIFFLNTRNQYGDEYGDTIFSKKIGQTNFEDQLKDSVLNNLAQMKAMDQIAYHKGLTLSEEELESTVAAAQKYFSLLSFENAKKIGVTQEDMEKLYQDYALANKLYYQMTSNADTEVSDDEARIAIVQQILIRTDSFSKEDETLEEEQKEAAFETAKEVWNKARDGADFTVLAESYNDAGTPTELTFGRNDMPAEYENTVFNMENNTISDIIETEEGYYIIKCIDNYDKELTDENKKTIIEKRQEEAFWNLYHEFMENAPSVFNDTAWKELCEENTEEIKTKEFFEIYHQFFSNEAEENE